jgi:UDP:flavonoid glycosyltransferase YjiC (YdhE family)
VQLGAEGAAPMTADEIAAAFGKVDELLLAATAAAPAVALLAARAAERGISEARLAAHLHLNATTMRWLLKLEPAAAAGCPASSVVTESLAKPLVLTTRQPRLGVGNFRKRAKIPRQALPMPTLGQHPTLRRVELRQQRPGKWRPAVVSGLDYRFWTVVHFRYTARSRAASTWTRRTWGSWC